MSENQRLDADVIVVGAGPVGLTISNTLGQYGVKVLLLEKGEELIDYPRAVGMDDECLRSIQGIGLAGGAAAPDALPLDALRHRQRPLLLHRAAHRRLRLVAPQRLQPARRRPGADGRPQAFPNVEVCGWARARKFDQDRRQPHRAAQARSAALRPCAASTGGSDGGRSFIRTTLGVGFGGFTDTSKWLVVDIRNDPLGVPNIYMHSDPQRPTCRWRCPTACAASSS
jgi:3-(3-hydroxy-phenyl)propionate hydroxylase